MKRQTWIVSRCEPWPSGEQCVEIATDVDHLDPSLFWERDGSDYDRLCIEWSDPRDAVDAAIKVRDLWVAESGKPVKIDHANPVFYGMDGKTDAELRAWAIKTYDEMPRCVHCSNVCQEVGMPGNYEDDVTGESFHACCDWHAELYLYAEHCHSEIEEETTA